MGDSQSSKITAAESLNHRNFSSSREEPANTQRKPHPWSFEDSPSTNPYAPPFAPPPVPPAEPSLAQSTALFTVGSLVGLTAVAALRWLNGDDFYLWPSTDELQGRRREGTMQQQTDHWNRTQDWPQNHTNDNDVPGQLLLQQMQVIQSNLEAQKEQQALIMQRLQDHCIGESRAITNDSMDRLRQSISAQNAKGDPIFQSESPMLVDHLRSIQQELVQLRNELSGLQPNSGGLEISHRWESRLLQTTDQLESCLRRLDVMANDQDTRMSSALPTLPVTDGSNEPLTHSEERDQQKEGPSDRLADTSSTPTTRELVDAIRRLVADNTSSALQAGVPLLFLYVCNLSNYPRVPRYRKIFTCNESFQKVDALKGARDLLTAVGFIETKNALEWHGDKANNEQKYLALLKDALAALKVLKAGTDDSNVLDAALAALQHDTLEQGGQEHLSTFETVPAHISTSSPSSSQASTPAREAKPRTPTRNSTVMEHHPIPPPPPSDDAYQTPVIGNISSPPAIKHTYSPNSFQFHCESPVLNVSISEQLEELLADTPDRVALADQGRPGSHERNCGLDDSEVAYLGDVVDNSRKHEGDDRQEG